MGFDGKTLVHPSQVDPANEAWSPSPDEIELSRRIIAAYREAEAEGRGVVTVDGRMIEHLHVANAERTLAIADAIAALGDLSSVLRDRPDRADRDGQNGRQAVTAATISS